MIIVLFQPRSGFIFSVSAVFVASGCCEVRFIVEGIFCEILIQVSCILVKVGVVPYGRGPRDIYVIVRFGSEFFLDQTNSQITIQS